MNKVLRERRDDIAAAMRGLCDAVGRLSLVRDDMIKDLERVPPGHPDERTALALQRTCEALTLAAQKVPDECWAILLTGNAVGGEEVRRRVETMINNTLVFNRVARLAVPA